MVRVRIAPSPTGLAHVGMAWMALFNYAFAKSAKGKFILRLEDTDTKRNIDDAEAAIYEGLQWLGLFWDEGPDKGGPHAPYKQSERNKLHRKKAQELLKKGLAYKEKGALRFKNPGEDVSWNDLVRGKVTFPGGEVTDFVLLRSDGRPTYNFAVVVDDIDMEITHVIRGEEHISNTPRQLALYKAFGVKPPEFAHLPTLRNKETRKKLSKRHDPVDLGLYQKEGYLSEALINFLCLLGWSHPKQKEIFDLDEFVDLFSIERVRKAGPVFDTDKLDWINGQYIRNLSDDELVKKLRGFIPEDTDKELIKQVVPLVKDRMNKLTEFKSLAGFFFKKPKVDNKLFGANYKKHLKVATTVLEKVDKWEKEVVDKKLIDAVKKNEFKTGEFFMDTRIAVTGKKVTPPINDSIIILGKKETLDRLRKIVE